MLKKLITLTLALVILAWANVSHAGFGISPPYVKTTKPIFLGGHYEQKVTLLRSEADVDLQAKLILSAPEIADWISIDKGDTFDLPKDQLRVPMVVRIDVPKDAEIGNYGGHINIRVVPKDQKEGGGVAIALGARVDIDITVTDETFLEFNIKKVDIPNFEILAKPWSWPIFSKLFYKSRVIVKVENTGNVKTAPSKIQLEVFDLSKNGLLESSIDKKLEKIDPFQIKDITANFPTSLEPGQYWGRVKVYNGENIIHKDELIFTVGNVGEFGGRKMGILPYLFLTSLIILAVLFIVLLVKVRSWRVILYFIIPFKYIFTLISASFKSLKIKFWRWMHKKSSQYQDIDSQYRKKR